MKRPAALPASPRRVLIFVDESNVTSSAKVSNRKLDWLKLRDFLVGERALLEMVVYAGLPPAMTEWQAERDRKNKFLHWLRAHGFLVVTKEGAPADEAHYKANVDVLLAIDAVELSTAMAPDSRPPSNLRDSLPPPRSCSLPATPISPRSRCNSAAAASGWKPLRSRKRSAPG